MLQEAFTKRMKTLLAEEYGAFLDSFSLPRAVALRLNPLKTQAPPDLSGFSLRPVPWEPCGFYYDPETRPGKSAYHEAGLYYLQEASAMAPAALLDPQPGERVLDEKALRDPVGTLERLSRGGRGRRFRLLPYQAVGVECGMLLALRLDDARVGAEDYGGILVALSPNPVSDGGGYSALIGET